MATKIALMSTRPFSIEVELLAKPAT